MTERFTCPRRIADGAHRDDGPFTFSGSNKDTWTTRAGLVGQALGCSYCGSLPSDDFMEAVRAHRQIEPTDKPYKFYLQVAHPEPGTLRVLGIATKPQPGYIAWADLDKKQRRTVKSSGRTFPEDHTQGFYSFTTWGETTEAKFYTHHLSDEQGWEFYVLWRAHKINWGYPGHPYVNLYLPGPSSAQPDDPRLG